MAYIKFKELTKYFYFSSKLEVSNLPKYALDYVDEDENIIIAYKTTRDKAIFTNKKVILFDVVGITGRKKVIHIIPYKSVSTSAISFSSKSANVLMTLDSGYQLKWKFIKMNPMDKTELRKVYSLMMKYTITDFK